VRALQVRVPEAVVPRVLSLAESLGARSPVALPALSSQGTTSAAGEALAAVLVTLPNDRVGRFVAAVTAESEDAAVLLLPVVRQAATALALGWCTGCACRRP
jgi:hypothetical protein